MSIAKKVARNFVFPTIISLGLEKIISSLSKKKNLILMYHGVVSKTDFNLSVNHLSVADFEKHLLYLRKNFEIVSLERIFTEKNIDKLRIAITFDDGYENNYLNAYPILKKYSIPATIFVVAKTLVDPQYTVWYDILDIIKNYIDLGELQAHDFKLRDKKIIQFNNLKNIAELKEFFKVLNFEEKERILQFLIHKNSSTIEQSKPEFRKMLKSNQLKEMSDSELIEIGSHTVNHPNLKELDDNEIKFELSESKRLLENSIGKKVMSIAFPDGSYDERIKKISRELGYKYMLAVDYKLSHDGNDNDILPRYCISNTTTPDSNFVQIHSTFRKKGF